MFVNQALHYLFSIILFQRLPDYILQKTSFQISILKIASKQQTILPMETKLKVSYTQTSQHLVSTILFQLLPDLILQNPPLFQISIIQIVSKLQQQTNLNILPKKTILKVSFNQVSPQQFSTILFQLLLDPIPQNPTSSQVSKLEIAYEFHRQNHTSFVKCLLQEGCQLLVRL